MKPLSLALVLLLGGCAVTRPEIVTVLRAAPDFGAPTAPRDGGVIAVTTVLARGAAADRRYAYVDPAAPREIRQAATLFWEEPPPRMLETALAEGLRARTSAAVTLGAGVEADKRVAAQLTRFEEVSGAPARAALAFDVTVTADRQVVLSGAYCGEAAVAGAAPSDRARAFEGAMIEAVEALAADLNAGAVQPSRAC